SRNRFASRFTQSTADFRNRRHHRIMKRSSNRMSSSVRYVREGLICCLLSSVKKAGPVPASGISNQANYREIPLVTLAVILMVAVTFIIAGAKIWHFSDPALWQIALPAANALRSAWPVAPISTNSRCVSRSPTLAGCVVAAQPRQFRPLEVRVWLRPPRARGPCGGRRGFPGGLGRQARGHGAPRPAAADDRETCPPLPR